MELNEFDDFVAYEDGELLNTTPSRQISLTKFFFILAAVFASMALASAVACLADEECRTKVPTIASLLSFQLTAPYIFFAFVTGIYVFSALSFALYVKTNNWLISAASFLVIISFGIILAVFPFVGWERNLSSFCLVICFFLWMLAVTWSLRKTVLHPRIRRGSIAMIILYGAASLTFIVLKSINPASVPHIDVGVLICEIVGGVSAIIFLFIAFLFVRQVKIELRPQ
jgi:hypothetical protein